MKEKIRETTVQGRTYIVWKDTIARGTFAEDENGTVKQIKGSGYISNDLAVRKAIAAVFHLGSFRK